MILYFSGTGNSHYTAKVLSRTLEDELQSMNSCLRDKHWEVIHSSSPLVVVTPTYAWRIPKVVEDYLSQVKIVGTSEIYFVMTCGLDIGNAGRYLRKLCRKKGLSYMGVAQIVMPENYIALFEVPDQDTAAAIVVKSEPDMVALAKKIRNGEKFAEKHVTVVDHLKSTIANPLFHLFAVSDKKFYAKENCNGCGACSHLCPEKNIKMKEGRPVWNGKCIHCMACINACPKEAIEYGKNSVGKPRYYLKVH